MKAREFRRREEVKEIEEEEKKNTRTRSHGEKGASRGKSSWPDANTKKRGGTYGAREAVWVEGGGRRELRRRLDSGA